MKKGIDISYCQSGLNFQAVKAAGVEFVIVRAGISTRTDTEFYKHMGGLLKTGLPYGFYWYSRAFSVEDAKKEAEACLNAIKPYAPTYPVFYDIEDQDQIDKLDNATRTAIIIAFYDSIKAAGYTPGVYINPTWLAQYVDKSKIVDRYDIWLAHWTYDPDKPTKYDYGQTIWQWGLVKIGGMNVDADICYAEYKQVTPAASDETDKTEGGKEVIGSGKYNVGDIVQFTGSVQYGSSDASSGVKATPGPVGITKYVPGTPHPYHVIHTDNTSNVYGWIDESAIEGASPSVEADWKPEVGDTVIYNGKIHYGSSDAEMGLLCTGGRAKITKYVPGAPHPYHLIRTDENNSTVYGWVDAGTFTKA